MKHKQTAARALLTEVEAAEFLALSVRALQSWRLRGGGPSFVKLGRAVRYRREDLDSFIGAGLRRHTSEAAQ